MSGESSDVALDLPRARQLSVGMRAYAEAMVARLPHVAPDLRFAVHVRTSALDASEQLALPLALLRTRTRLVHFLSVYAPLLGPRPYVITIHDLIHLRFPAHFKQSVGGYYRTVVRAICARAARVITDDERTIADLHDYLGVAPEKIAVVPLGVDDRFFADVEPAIESRPYFLYVGNHREHKDLRTLFSAWQALPQGVVVDLAVTGDDDLDPALERPQRAGGELRFLGDVSTDRLARLYRGAVALVHPALCEGFGLPMLEAAAVGAAVIASEDAVPTVLRPYVDIFPAKDVRALAGLMERTLGTAPVQEGARRLARTLTWDRCAERTAEVYRNVLKEKAAG